MDYKIATLEQVAVNLETIQKIDTVQERTEQLRPLLDQARIAKIVSDGLSSVEDGKVKAEIERKKLSQEALRTELDRDRLKLDEAKLKFEETKLTTTQDLETTKLNQVRELECKKLDFEREKFEEEGIREEAIRTLDVKKLEAEVRKIELDEKRFEFEKMRFYADDNYRLKELVMREETEKQRSKIEMWKLIASVIGAIAGGVLNGFGFGLTYKLAMSTLHLETFENGRPKIPFKEQYSNLKRFF